MLQRYNVLSDKHVKEPVRVVAVNESMSSAVSGPGMGPVVAEGTVGVHISGMEADVVDTVPKTMQAKASRLMEDLKRDVAWTARGELIHEGVPIEPTYGWRRRLLLLVEHQLLLVLLLVVHDHSVGHPSFIDVVGWNIPCPPHPRNAHAMLWRHWLVGKTFKAVRSVAQCSLCRPIHRTRTVPSSLWYFTVDFT